MVVDDADHRMPGAPAIGQKLDPLPDGACSGPEVAGQSGVYDRNGRSPAIVLGKSTPRLYVESDRLEIPGRNRVGVDSDPVLASHSLANHRGTLVGALERNVENDRCGLDPRKRRHALA